MVGQVKITTSEGGASRKIFWNRATIVVKSVELVNTFHLPTRKCCGNREKLPSFGLLPRVRRHFGSCAETFVARVCRLYWLVCTLFWLVCADFIGSRAPTFFVSSVQTLLARVRRHFWLVCADFIGSCV